MSLTLTPRQAYQALINGDSVEPALYDLCAPCVNTLAELRAVAGTSLRLVLYHSRWLTRAALLLEDYTDISYAELLDIYVMTMLWRDRLAVVGQNLIGIKPINVVEHFSTRVLPFMREQQLQQLVDSPIIPDVLKRASYDLMGICSN